MSKQTESEKEAFEKLYSLQHKIKGLLFNGKSHRNIRRGLGISLKEYIVIMALTKK